MMHAAFGMTKELAEIRVEELRREAEASRLRCQKRLVWDGRLRVQAQRALHGLGQLLLALGSRLIQRSRIQPIPTKKQEAAEACRC